jgi:DNA-binding transcriptional MerR regulator
MDTYTISQIAEKMSVSASALLFHDEEGLLPFVERVNGQRIFKDGDFAWLRVINCLKNSGMPITEIRYYIDLSFAGDPTLQERYEIILCQKKEIQNQID